MSINNKLPIRPLLSEGCGVISVALVHLLLGSQAAIRRVAIHLPTSESI
jgi:hypothetical protein